MPTPKSITSANESCPLCGSENTDFFTQDLKRAYFNCANCQMVFVPRQWHLSAELEKREYDKHENDVCDPGYRLFLSRLTEPLTARLPDPCAEGLDFGCGPAPALAVMMEELGYRVDLYDKFYLPQRDFIHKQYHFITATEVVEHLANPGRELTTLWQRLAPGGLLGVMTKRWLSKERFLTWHYKNDLTHISFFHLNTFEWLALQWSAELVVAGNDVIILVKP